MTSNLIYNNPLVQVPVEACKNKAALDILEDFIFCSSCTCSHCIAEKDMYFMLGIDFWVGNRDHYILKNLTNKNQ